MKTPYFLATLMLFFVSSTYCKGNLGEPYPASAMVDFTGQRPLFAGSDHSNSETFIFSKFNSLTEISRKIRLPLLNFKSQTPARKEFAFLYWDLKVSIKLSKNLLLVVKYN